MSAFLKKYSIFKDLCIKSQRPFYWLLPSARKDLWTASKIAHKISPKSSFHNIFRPLIPVRNNRDESSKDNNFYFVYASMGFSFSLLFGEYEDDKSDDSSSINKIMFHAGAAIQSDELNKSEQLFHLALKSAQEVNNLDLISQIMAKLGFLATLQKDWNKAEKLFTETLQLYFKLGKEQNDNAVIEVSLRLSTVFSQLGKFDSAVEGFQYCISCQQLKISTLNNEADDDTLVLLGLGYDGLASLLESINECDLAKTYWEKALKICLHVLGEANLHTAVILSHLANLSFRKKDFAHCEELLKRAIDIASKAKSADVVSYYISLAWVYRERGLDTQAEELFIKSLELARLTENEAFIKDTINLIKGGSGK